MKEVSLLVYKQGEMIDSIFANVESAKNYVVKGEAVLKKEKEEHKKSRKVRSALSRKCAASSSSDCS
jgi:t-SNARE complex subunit (syntaxin)